MKLPRNLPFASDIPVAMNVVVGEMSQYELMIIRLGKLHVIHNSIHSIFIFEIIRKN